MTSIPVPRLPDYSGACTANVVPELIKQLMGRPIAAWMPEPVRGATQIVLLVIDGLGWNQLTKRVPLAPTLAGFEGGPITTVAPTTTATALTSIVTGRPPASHGLVGYRLAIGGDQILNVLKWTADDEDARQSVPPETFQRHPAFAGNTVPVVTRNHFSGTGFTDASLQGANLVGYSAPSGLPLEVWRLIKEGEPLVYAYYDLLDTVAHVHGFGDHYDAEFYTVDRLIRDLLAGLPSGTALVVTADHGQVEVGDNLVVVKPEVDELVTLYSGESRFLWLHAKEGQAEALLEQARQGHSDVAWVHSRQEVIDGGFYGGPLSDEVTARLGDVALIPFAPVALVAANHNGENRLVCRHGSLTADEVLVPLLAKLV